MLRIYIFNRSVQSNPWVGMSMCICMREHMYVQGE